MYDILSRTDFIFLPADTVLWCTKNPAPNCRFSFPFPQKKLQSPSLTDPPLCNLTFCRPTECNLYLANSLAAAVVRESDLQRLLKFQIPNLMSVFHCLGRTKVSVQVLGFLCERFGTCYIFAVRSCQQLAQPPSWRTTPCLLSATAYSIYSQLPSILEAVQRYNHFVYSGGNA